MYLKDVDSSLVFSMYLNYFYDLFINLIAKTTSLN